MVRKMFQKLFGWPCDHDWETLQDGVKFFVSYVDYPDIKDNGTRWIYRCKKCCKSKKIESQ